MELKQLQSLAAVIHYRSFTKAAEKLYLSQPTISTHIRMLEEELQCRLIMRTTKSIEATPRGMELYDCALRMLSLQDALLEKWAEENQKIIHMGISTIPADYILPEIFPVFHRLRPDVQLHIRQSDSGAVIDGLMSGRFALGMVGMERTEPSLLYVPFYQDRMVMITPDEENYAALESEEELRNRILQEPVILREKGSGSRKCMEAYFERLGIDEGDLHVIARLNGQESIKRLVAGGLGISFISEKAVEGFERNRGIKVFSLPGNQASRNLYLVYKKDLILKEHVADFVEFVRAYYKNEWAS